MKAIKFILLLVTMFFEMMYLMVMAVTVTAALYILVTIIYWLKDFFKHAEAHQQPGNAVGLHNGGFNDSFCLKV